MSLLDLPDELFTDIIIPHIEDISTLINLSMTSKRYNRLCKSAKINQEIEAYNIIKYCVYYIPQDNILVNVDNYNELLYYGDAGLLYSLLREEYRNLMPWLVWKNIKFEINYVKIHQQTYSYRLSGETYGNGRINNSRVGEESHIKNYHIIDVFKLFDLLNHFLTNNLNMDNINHFTFYGGNFGILRFFHSRYMVPI